MKLTIFTDDGLELDTIEGIEGFDLSKPHDCEMLFSEIRYILEND